MSQLFDEEGIVLGGEEATQASTDLLELDRQITRQVHDYFQRHSLDGLDSRALASWLSSTIDIIVVGHILTLQRKHLQ
jgi:hypothetical protein